MALAQPPMRKLFATAAVRKPGLENLSQTLRKGRPASLRMHNEATAETEELLWPVAAMSGPSPLMRLPVSG